MTAPRTFYLVKTIGSGGQGVVWEARSPLGETVAYKVFQPDPESSSIPTDRHRFTTEIRTQSRLNHRNIVQVIEDGVTVNGDPFYVMELAGSTLQKRVDASPGGLPRHDTLMIFQRICEAMAYAHSQGILHRDLKPSNILLYGDNPKVADFGLGRDLMSDTRTYTRSKDFQGTLGYMAPEQLVGGLHNAEKPADVYALGKVLYHTLTGRSPMTVDRSRMPDDLQFIVYKSTHEKPEDRFSDCGALLASLNSAIGADPSRLAPPTDQAKAALTAFSSGDFGALDQLVRVLLTYPQDSVLYLRFAPTIPKNVLKQIAKNQSAAQTVVANFDIHAADNASFAYADTIADFLDPFFTASEDPDLRRKILLRRSYSAG